MNRSSPTPSLPPSLAAFLTGAGEAGPRVDLQPADIVSTCREHQVAALLHERLRRAGPCGWPETVVDDLACEARAEAARELVRRNEIAAVLASMTARGVRPVLVKGTPLAYTIYPTPSARPRSDTDVLLPRAQIDAAREILTSSGYVPAFACDGELLFRQTELQKTDRFGVVHAWDLHWTISTQALFADLLTYDELARDAIPVPALGPSARTASLPHALLLACVHPAMHHRNDASVLWMLDVHLLVSRMTAAQLTAFAQLAASRRVAAIVLSQLAQTANLWGTRLPRQALATLRRAARAGEPSAEYLRPGRRWYHEFAANLRHLPGWRPRVQLLREVAFPSRSYMRRAYGLPTSGLWAVLLPGLYAARLMAGLGKLLSSRKI